VLSTLVKVSLAGTGAVGMLDLGWTVVTWNVGIVGLGGRWVLGLRLERDWASTCGCVLTAISIGMFTTTRKDITLQFT